MRVVVGLGNPGSKYEGTRHNVGFDVIWELTRRWGAGRSQEKFEAELSEARVGDEKVLLVRPQTYMNLSGRSVSQLVKFYQLPLDDLLVICDDLNLKTGQLRLRGAGSAGGQKGLVSIIQSVGSERFPRLRVGIDRPAEGQDAATYVLAKFRKEELDSMDDAARRAAAGVELWVAAGLEAAMNQINAGN